MKRGRGMPFVLFVLCLLAGMPFAWGQVGLEDVTLEPSASLSDEVRIDALKVTVTMCHFPPGDPANAQTITVAQAAVNTHLAHGDYFGECRSACDGVPAAVPTTGQTTCYDSGGAVIDCAGTGEDGEYQTGVSVDPRFTDNLDGTVKDNLTELIWLKNANCFGLQYWQLALLDAKNLASGSCGLTDASLAGAWRLPNIREMHSLIDYGQSRPSLPPGHPFSGVQLEGYWSSTSFALRPNGAWFVSLESGDVYRDDGHFDNTYCVWPVRGGR